MTRISISNTSHKSQDLLTTYMPAMSDISFFPIYSYMNKLALKYHKMH